MANRIKAGFIALVVACGGLAAMAQQRGAPAPASVRVYMFDCGLIKAMGVQTYGFKDGEVPPRDFFVPCYLIAHPRGTLMWDVGVIPDTAFPAGGGPGTQGSMSSAKTLRSQMAEAGYKASDITYLAMSHYHSDHTANAADFAGSTWLVRQVERDAVFAEKPPGIVRAEHFAALKNSKTTILKDDEYDVFGDGTVVIKSAPGHTPGHQVLFVKLAKTGPVLIAGDLYHFPEERTLNRFPTFEFNKEQSATSRAMVDEFLKKTGAQLWIEHDLATAQKLKKAPAYYD
jgi:glyoxylase-like metal-dependent hydrolase (beta-lactamase superfamily II)